MDISFRSEKVMVTKHYVNLDGMEVEFGELFDLLSEIDCGDVIVTDRKLGEHLIKAKVLKNLGNSRWYMGAEKGENFDELLTSLETYRFI